MKIHLVDTTYELFRSYFGKPRVTTDEGREVGAVRGLIQTLLLLLREEGATHVACAFDHVIESFRNDLFSGYKTSEGLPPDLLSQFYLAEQVARALGIIVWPMEEFEADDAIATAAVHLAVDKEVKQVIICSPDKDLMQVVQGNTIVCLDRRRKKLYDFDQVREKLGVNPESIPDYLALVGDPADGIPGIKRWGNKSTAKVLSEYHQIESIPNNYDEWTVKPRGAKSMSTALEERRTDAMLYKSLTRLRLDVPLTESRDDLEWKGAHQTEYEALCTALGFQNLKNLPHRWQ